MNPATATKADLQAEVKRLHSSLAQGGRITVAVRTVNETVEVSVTDTGTGIAPEDCEAVFEEFRQVGTHAEGKAQALASRSPGSSSSRTVAGSG